MNGAAFMHQYGLGEADLLQLYGLATLDGQGDIVERSVVDIPAATYHW
jgi:hypothetical protein